MAKIGRNDPCPCGSRLKAKRCCGAVVGPGPDTVARQYLATERRRAVVDLIGLGDQELAAFSERLFDMPRLDLSLIVSLPGPFTPDVERLIDAFAVDDPDSAEAAFPAVLARIDSPTARADLARGIVGLRDEGKIDRLVAAVALVDLGGSSNAVMRASLVHAASIAAGITRTPAGLVLA